MLSHDVAHAHLNILVILVGNVDNMDSEISCVCMHACVRTSVREFMHAHVYIES